MKKPEKWKPKEDEWCYRLMFEDHKGASGIILIRYWESVHNYSVGIYKTKKQAQSAIKRIKEVLRG